MAREVFIVLNVSTNDVEIKDFGLIIPADVSVDLADFDKSLLSEELNQYLLDGDLVRLIQGASVGYSESFVSDVPLSVNYLPEASLNLNTFFFDSSSLLDISVGKYETKKFLAGKSSTQVLSGSYSDVTSWDLALINTSTIADPYYTWDETNGILTFDKAGWYEINVQMNTDVLSGGTRANTAFKVLEDTGSGYIDIPYSETWMYNRTSGQGADNGSFFTLRQYSDGDTLKIQALEDAGDNQITSAQISVIKSEIGASLTIFDVSGGVSQLYVDGSLLQRDASIEFLFNNGLEFLYESSLGAGFVFNDTTDVYDVSITGAVGLYAWARTTGAGGVIDTYGLTVSRTGTGVYQYTFNSPLTNANYGILGQPFGTIQDTNCQVANVTNTGFELTFGSGDNGTAPDVPVDTEHSVMVLGPPTEVGLGVSRDYVDGSLALRDVSIHWIVDNTYTRTYIDGSLNVKVNSTLFDSSILSLTNANISQDASITSLRDKNLSQDSSIVGLRNVNTSQDASIIRIDGSINNLYNTKVDRAGDTMTGKLTVPSLDVTGDVSLNQKIHFTEYINSVPENGDLWVDPSGMLMFVYPITTIDASSYNLTNRLLRTDNDWSSFPDTSTLDDGDRILIEDAQDGFKKKFISKSAFATGITGGFGQFSAYADSLAISSTTSTTYQNKLSLTTDASGVADTYRVGWSVQITNSNNNQSTEYRVTVDGVEIDSNLVVLPRAGSYNNYAGFQHIDLSTGSHTINVDYRRGSGGTARIKDVRVEFWRTGVE